MAATLIALRWKLLRNSLTRSVGALIGSIFGALYALGGLAALIAGSIALGQASAGLIAGVQAMYAAAITLGWLVWPLLFSGVDGSLDPRAMSAWIAPSPRLARGLILAGLAGLPGMVTTIALFLPAVSWAVAGNSLGVGLSIVAAPIGALTCVLLSRVVVVGLGVSQSRRMRELTGIIGILLIVGIAWLPNLVLNSSALDGVTFQAGMIGDAVAIALWSPFGWWAGLPGFGMQGAWIPALLTLVLALALIGGLMVAWGKIVTHVMTHPAGGSSRSHAYGKRRHAGSGAGAGTADVGQVVADDGGVLRSERFFERFLPTPAAAMASRCLTYWLRDPRYLVQGVLFLVMPFIMVLPAVMGGSEASGASVVLAWGQASRIFLLIPPLAAAFWASLLANDLGMDSTALWQQVSAGVSGRHDRMGRIAGAWALQVPILVIFSVVFSGWCGAWWVLPGILGLSLTILAAGTAWSCFAMVMVPYETQAPGESVLKSKTSGMAFLGSLVLMLGWLAAPVVASPVIALTVAGIVKESLIFNLAGGVVGLLEMAALLVLAVRSTGRLYERRVTDVLTTIRSWPGHAEVR